MASPFDLGGLDIMGGDPLSPAQAQDPLAMAQAAAYAAPTSGFAIDGPPLVKPADPNIRKAIFNAGLGILSANEAGEGFSGQLAGGLAGYQNSLSTDTETERKARQQQLAEYALLGSIQTRQNAQLAAAQKLNAIKSLKEQHPEMAALIDVDPEGAAKQIAADMTGKYENVGGVLYKIQNGQAKPVSSPGGPTTPIDPNVTGDAVLSSIPPNQASTVKAIAEGRMALPSSAALKQPYWQNMISLVGQYDPTFDVANAPARVATRKAFTSGKEAGQINALNTAIGHLSGLKIKSDALQNGQYPLLNAGKNFIQTQEGKQAQSGYAANQKAVADEVAKVWRATGGSEADIQENLKNLSANQSPAQFKETFATIGDLLKSKIDSLNDQYRRGLGTVAGDKHFFTPHAIKALSDLGVTDLPDPAKSELIQPSPADPIAPATTGDLSNIKATNNTVQAINGLIGDQYTGPNTLAGANGSAVRGAAGAIPATRLSTADVTDPLALSTEAPGIDDVEPDADTDPLAPQIPATAEPTPEEIQELVDHPETADSFNAHFPGYSADVYLERGK